MNADVADQFELLADLLELEGYDTFRVLAYRRAATRIRETGRLDRPARARRQGQGSPGDREDDRGEDRRDRRRRRGARADQAQGSSCPRRSSLFMRLPGLGPKTARRIWQELDVTTLDGLEAGRRGAAASDADRARGEGRGERAAGARRAERRLRSRLARFSARRFPPFSPPSTRCARIRRRSRSPRPGASGGVARPFATWTSSPPPVMPMR